MINPQVEREKDDFWLDMRHHELRSMDRSQYPAKLTPVEHELRRLNWTFIVFWVSYAALVGCGLAWVMWQWL
jgi:hypothetical protein